MTTLADIQRKVGVTPDGLWGPNTANAIAKALGMDQAPTVLRVVPKVAIDLIKSFEGCKLNAYPDPGTGAEPITIGWGSTGSDIHLGLTWTQQQADDRFLFDLTKFGDGVSKLLGTAPTTDNQFGAMVSLAYNIGLQAFKESTLLRLHKEGNYVGARAQFPRWSRSGGQVMRGLERRRAAEADIYGD